MYRGWRSGGLMLALGLAACSTSLQMLRFSTPGEQQASVWLDATREVRFWTDFDATYGGTLEARFDVELAQDGKLVAKTICDPLRPRGPVTVCRTNIELGARYQVNCRMQCNLSVPRSGPTQVRAPLRLLTPDPPIGLRLDRANLSVEQ